MCIQEYVAAVAQDQTAAAEKAAMLMSATGGAHAGVGSEYVIEPPSTLTAEDSDNGSEGENDDDIPLDRQASPHEWMIHSATVCVTEAHRGTTCACFFGGCCVVLRSCSRDKLPQPPAALCLLLPVLCAEHAVCLR